MQYLIIIVIRGGFFADKSAVYRRRNFGLGAFYRFPNDFVVLAIGDGIFAAEIQLLHNLAP